MTTELPDSMPTPSSEALRAFRDCYMRIHSPMCAERLWNRHLSAEDRERLDGDLEAAYEKYRTARMWAMLRGVSLKRAVLDVGFKLNFLSPSDYEWLLREIGEDSPPEESLIAAIAAGDLVLIERPREVHWSKEEITIDWGRYHASWEFLWELSLHAKSGDPVDRMTFGKDAAEDVVAKRKYQLTKMPQFPITLADLIVPVGRGTQRLNLAPERIRIFEPSETGGLVERRR